MAQGDKRKPQRRPENASEQSRRFIRAARELGADQSEEAFNEALRKVATAPVTPKKPKGKLKEPGSEE